MHMDVLDRDLLLNLATMAVERLDQSRVGARELVGFGSGSRAGPRESVLRSWRADRAPIAFHAIASNRPVHGIRSGPSGVTEQPYRSKNVSLIVTALEEAGVVVESGASGSSANASAYMISARFLDGGLAGVTGNYFYYARGVFVWGPLFVRYIAEKINARISPRYEALLQR
jgi:hypothetical protein